MLFGIKRVYTLLTRSCQRVTARECQVHFGVSIKMSSLEVKQRKVRSFKGPMVASVTLFKDDGSVNEDSLANYVKYLVKIGVKGAYVHGTTGEGVTLSHEEKKSLTKAWIKVVKENQLDFLVVINVSSCSFNDVVDHAKFCQQLDADAIAFLPPFYYKPADAAQLAKYVAEVSLAVPEMPTFYYHFPDMTGVRIPPSEWLPLVFGKVRNFTAVKFTDKDMTELARSLRMFDGKVKFYPGYEDSVLTATAVGADAFIGAMYNLPNEVQWNYEIVNAVHKGDWKTAREKQGQFADSLKQVLSGAGLIPNLKLKINALSDTGFSAGTARPPLHYK